MEQTTVCIYWQTYTQNMQIKPDLQTVQYNEPQTVTSNHTSSTDTRHLVSIKNIIYNIVQIMF